MARSGPKGTALFQKGPTGVERGPVPGTASHVAGGALKSIALLAASRSALFPGLATAHEPGLTEAITWNAFFMPKGTPVAIVRKINDVTNEAMNDPHFGRRMH